ncbi:MAG: c-type cytochrome [Deltaproteobacteria bacterium]|nr:c-type cytochrome [Deltaproteobacteria bacterium]MCB9786422.1 c-type cytochrome [Deltaproteobacteria bacterium]
MAERPQDAAVDTGHVYDGIHELDNRLPNWWLLTFWGSIVFAMVYWFLYQSAGILPSHASVFQEEKAAWEAKMLAASVTPEEITALVADPEAVARGAETFTTYCVACHGPDAGGKIGPNLTDKWWIHGGDPVSVYKTVSNGVIEKGMVAWRPTLGDAKVRDVVAYVITLREHPVEGKAPEGKDAEGNAAP